MPEVVYYVLTAPSQQDKWLTACKLIEKAFKQGYLCNILTESEHHSKLIDDLLWTFRQGSFIPHQILRSSELPQVPQILISAELNLLPKQHILVNLSRSFSEEFMLFQRVLEILENDPDVKQAGRERYRSYQLLGANLVTHNL